MMRPNLIGWGIVAFFFFGGLAFVVAVPDVWLLGLIWMVVALGLAALYLSMSRRANRAERLKREGIPGKARILELTQTGAYFNEQPRVRLKLRVEAPGVSTFECKHTYTVPLVALGAFSKGDVLPVYLDRANSSRFTIDWLGGDGDEAQASTKTPHEQLEELTELRKDGLITDTEFEQQKARILGSI
jgi:hypothetical protein